jgi:hypothetical protein
MSLRQQAHLCTLPLLLAFSGVSIAGTLSTVGMGASGMFNGGTPTSCGDSSATTASCSFFDYNMDPYGGESASGSASASSAFEMLSATASANAGQSIDGANGTSVQGGYTAEFDNPVVVTGGSGTGTLVADFSWTALATVNATSDAFWPTFAASVGASSSSWTGIANLPSSNLCEGPVPCQGTGTLDVSSSFTFGALIDVDGSTAVGINTLEILGQSFPISLGQDGNSSSSLTVTFLVYDAAGNLVPGAIVTPVLTSTPEPGSISLLLCGALMLGMRCTRFSSKNRPQHSTFHS